MMQWPAGWQLEGMTARDLVDVMPIENAVYPFPWSRGNFEDSLKAGYAGQCLRDAALRLVGYAIIMSVVDEWHVLNFTIAPTQQGKGLGKQLLNTLLIQARQAEQTSMLLEVRASNRIAHALYLSLGFEEIGRRKGYYPAVDGREDALVLRHALQQSVCRDASSGLCSQEDAR